jgi:hypothetical protein
LFVKKNKKYGLAHICAFEINNNFDEKLSPIYNEPLVYPPTGLCIVASDNRPSVPNRV